MHLSLNVVRMKVGLLVHLIEGMVVGLYDAIVAVSSEVGFGSLLILDFDNDSFDLKGQQFYSDVNFQVVGIKAIVSGNRVKVIILLAFVLIMLHHLRLLIAAVDAASGNWLLKLIDMKAR